jgi:hypothetical protein
MTSPGPPVGDNPAGSGEQRWRHRMRWTWIAAVCAVIVAVVACGAVWWLRPTPPTSDTQRWSGFPHQMGCTADDAPQAVRADQVTLSHLGGQRVKVSVHFVEQPGIDSRWYWISLFGPGDKGNVTIFSPNDVTGTGWYARRMDYVRETKKTMNGDQVPHYHDGNLLERDSVRTDGDGVEFVVDLDSQPGLFGPGPFRPNVVVTALTVDQSPFSTTLSWCRWD